MEEELISVKSDNPMLASLEIVRQTYNQFAERVNENPKMTINMELYCRDVSFLLKVVSLLLKDIEKKEKANG